MEFQHHGYPSTSFLQEHVPAEFNCIICLQVLSNPYQCRNGDVFCFKCISEWFRKGHDSCPGCRAFLTLDLLIPNKIVKNIIDGMLIKCDKKSFEKDDFCDWIGTEENFSNYFETIDEIREEKLNQIL